jgi:hypothetical protein
MFTGALAASYYGVPRTTTDADVVVKISRKGTHTELVEALRKAGLQADDEKIQASLESGYRIVTFKDRKTPFTLDIILSSKKLEKKTGTILGLSTFYQKPEELILAKLRMIKATISKGKGLKDENDVKAILKFTEVDIKTVKRRAQKNNTSSILEAIIGDPAG